MNNQNSNSTSPQDNNQESAIDVLLVDDEQATLQVLKEMLENSGYEVFTATDGEDARDKLLSAPTRTVITDWKMPKMDGLELCQWIRNNSFPWYVHILMLTGHGSETNATEALNAGADEFLSKPVSYAELRARMRTITRMKAFESQEVAIIALANLAESRDPETGDHLHRIKKYIRILAERLRNTDKFAAVLHPSQVDLICQTSVLHDIGKVGIPDHILLKPGLLNESEFRIMQQHTTIGADALKSATDKMNVVDYFKMAKDIILTHHERYDGTGYPQGLKGEDIPLPGRMMALVDVYDALTTKRVYKNAIPHDEAKSIIVSGKGTQFDPDIVDAFLENEEEFKQRLENEADFAEQSLTTDESSKT